MSTALFAHIRLLPKVTRDVDPLFICCQMATPSSPFLSQLQGNFGGSFDGDTGHFTLVEP